MLSPFEFSRESMETETKTWSEFHNQGKAIVEQTFIVVEERNLEEQDCEKHSQGSE